MRPGCGVGALAILAAAGASVLAACSPSGPCPDCDPAENAYLSVLAEATDLDPDGLTDAQIDDMFFLGRTACEFGTREHVDGMIGPGDDSRLAAVIFEVAKDELCPHMDRLLSPR